MHDRSRLTSGRVSSSPLQLVRPLAVQRKCKCGGRSPAGLDQQCDECRGFARKARSDGGPARMQDPEGLAERLGAGTPLAGATRASMETAFGRGFGNVRVHADADAAALSDDLDAHAFTVGEHIAFGRGEYRPGTPAGDALLAHELAHVVQQSSATSAQAFGKTDAGTGALEADADRAAAAAVGSIWAGKLGLSPQAARRPAMAAAPQLQRCGKKKPPEKAMTYDQMLVERAKWMIPLLEKYEEEWGVRQARRYDEKGRRDTMLQSRKDIEDPLAVLGKRPEMEADRIAQLNRKPLRIEVTETKVVFRVKFQARFEDPKQRGQFATLKAAVEEGARRVWNRDVDKAMAGKSFEVIPEVTEVSANAKRDRNAWLITVRPTDKSKPAHPGCKFDDPGSVVVAATDPTCDGGVMSLFPSGIGDPDLIGHELLHLFGLVDRYMLGQHVKPDGTVETMTFPMRETKNRRDPLAGEKGTVLQEDIAFLFDQLGVYEVEQNRGLAVLRQLEAKGMGIGDVKRELARQREILRLGRDPNSLIRHRKDFNDKMQKSAEDL